MLRDQPHRVKVHGCEDMCVCVFVAQTAAGRGYSSPWGYMSEGGGVSLPYDGTTNKEGGAEH